MAGLSSGIERFFFCHAHVAVDGKGILSPWSTHERGLHGSFNVKFCVPFIVVFFFLMVQQPVELFTKYGRRGRIKEPVGTKGGVCK